MKRIFLILVLLVSVFFSGSALGAEWYSPERSTMTFYLGGNQTTQVTKIRIYDYEGSNEVMVGPEYSTRSGDPKSIISRYNRKTGEVKISLVGDKTGIIEVFIFKNGEKIKNQNPIIVSVLDVPRFENIDLGFAYYLNRRFVQLGQRITIQAYSRMLEKRVRNFSGWVITPTGEIEKINENITPKNGVYTVLDILVEEKIFQGKYLLYISTTKWGKEVGSFLEFSYEKFHRGRDWSGPKIAEARIFDALGGAPSEREMFIFGRFPQEPTGEILVRVGRNIFSVYSPGRIGGSYISFFIRNSLLRRAGEYDVSIYFPSSGITVSKQGGLNIKESSSATKTVGTTEEITPSR